jgi:hypothetical protein
MLPKYDSNVPTNGHKVARKKFIALNLNPFLLSLHIQEIWLLTHAAEFTNGLNKLEDHSAFEND